MTYAQTLSRLAAADVHPQTYLRAWLMGVAGAATRGRCCGNPRCEDARTIDLADWLERTAWTRVGEA